MGKFKQLMLFVLLQCATPCLQAIKRHGKPSKGFTAAAAQKESEEAARKKPYHLFLAIDESATHVGDAQTLFRCAALV